MDEMERLQRFFDENPEAIAKLVRDAFGADDGVMSVLWENEDGTVETLMVHGDMVEGLARNDALMAETWDTSMEQPSMAQYWAYVEDEDDEHQDRA